MNHRIIGLATGGFIGSVVFLMQPVGASIWTFAVALGVGLGIGAVISHLFDETKNQLSLSNVAKPLTRPSSSSIRLDNAQSFLAMLSDKQGQVQDDAVSEEIGELIDVSTLLVQYVQNYPHQSTSLSAFLSSYSAQTEQVLTGYITVEKYHGKNLDATKQYTISALNALEGAAQGVLDSANDQQSTAVEASSEAINRLAAMQGFTPDADHPSEALQAAEDLKRLTVNKPSV